MRWVAAAIVIGCVAGAALAEEASAPGAPEPIRVQLRPYEFDRLVPSHAVREEISGRVDLCCTVRADRTLNCAVAHQTPARVGFGRAALNMVRGGRLSPEDFAALEPSAETQVHIPVEYVVSGRPRAGVDAPDADHASALCGTIAPIEAAEIVISVTLLRDR
ncbi:MAG: hypothetical protein R3C16_09035 [Hyphomonadaceae bacterium]